MSGVSTTTRNQDFALQSEDPIHTELNRHEWGLLASRLRQEPTSSAKLAGE